MGKINLIPVGQGNAGWRRDQMEEHGLVALVEIVVNWIQSDVHGTGARREANGRTVVYAIEPIVFAQFGRTLLRVEKHEEFASQIPGAQHAELRPVDVVLSDQRLRSIRVNKFKAHHRRWYQRIV